MKTWGKALSLRGCAIAGLVTPSQPPEVDSSGGAICRGLCRLPLRLVHCLGSCVHLRLLGSCTVKREFLRSLLLAVGRTPTFDCAAAAALDTLRLAIRAPSILPHAAAAALFELGSCPPADPEDVDKQTYIY